MNDILEKSYDININNSLEIIKYYEDNKLYFDNYDKISDFESIEEIILIKQKYCEAIERKHHYIEAALVLDHIFILFEKLKGNSEKYEYYYERALFYQGVLLGRKKKYKESNDRFKRLILIDSKNENYRDWFDTNNEHIIIKKLNVVFYPIVVFFGFVFVTKDKFIGDNHLIIETLLFVILAGILLYQHYIVKKNRDKRRKKQIANPL